MVSRRRILAGIGTSIACPLAGCTGGIPSNDDSGDNSDASSSSSTESPSADSSGQITDVTGDGGEIRLSIADSSDVERINLINDAGESVDSTSVATGASRVSFTFLEFDSISGSFEGRHEGDYRFVAVDSEGDEVGSADFTYAPEIELTAVSTGAAEYPENEESEQWLVLTVTNVGTGPAAFTSISSEHESGMGVVSDHANTDVADPLEKPFIREERSAGSGSLDTYEHRQKEHRSEHILRSGESKTYIVEGFFRSEAGGYKTEEYNTCNFDHTFSVTINGVPDEERAYEVDVHFSGELLEESGGFSGMRHWCSDPEIRGFEELSP